MELTLTMDTAPQVIKINEVHGIAGRRRSGEKASSRGALNHREHRDLQRHESSAHDWRSVRSRRIEGMGKVGRVPPP
jgi:hypothetical protein